MNLSPLFRSLHVILLAASLSSGCAPKVSGFVPTSGYQVRTVALLPVVSEEPIQRERLELLQRLLVRELRSSGFQVLDLRRILRSCRPPACSLNTLAEQYDVDALAQLTIHSTSRMNLLAGFYNSIDGALELQDRSGLPIGTIEHTQREPGGLLFNSGQLFEGIQSTAENFADNRFVRLAERFVRTLVVRLPPPHHPASNTHLLALQSVEVVPRGTGRYEVCAVGTEGVFASLVVRGDRFPMREVAPGRYCIAALLDLSTPARNDHRVELRTSYGSFIEARIDGELPSSCTLETVLTAAYLDHPQLSLTCPNSSDQRCEVELEECRNATLIVYRASESTGPFNRVGSTRRTPWVDRSAAPRPRWVYEVLAKSDDGTVSVPVAIEARREVADETH